MRSAQNVLREDHPVGADRCIVEAIGVRIDRLVNARCARDRDSRYDAALRPPPPTLRHQQKVWVSSVVEQRASGIAGGGSLPVNRPRNGLEDGRGRLKPLDPRTPSGND